jgi:DNA-binding response OmpR family regulator
MIKPFRKIELIARIKNLLRNKITPDVISQPHGPFHFGSTFMDLYINERLVSLTYAEGKLINKMLSTKNRQLSYKEISETIWGQYHTNDKILIKNYILRLRKKIEDTPNDPKYLRNIRNYGYSLL